MEKTSTLLGFLLAVFVMWAGVISHSSRPWIFLDAHALIVVIGGTLAAGFIAYPLRRFQDLWRFLMLAVLYPSKTAMLKVVEETIRLHGIVNYGYKAWEMKFSSHPFLAEGYKLIRRDQLGPEEFQSVLIKRNQFFKDRYQSDAKMLIALAKFPPAFGLLGATTGMIAMMSGLGVGGEDTIGPAMAIALVATFWGIALSNFLLLPLADHAKRLAEEQSRLRNLMINGLIMVHRRTSIELLYQTLIGYLPLEQRDDAGLMELKRALETLTTLASDMEITVTDTRERRRNAR
jgi:chemotaxis protein MotA